MEKNTKGNVKYTQGNINTDEWIKLYVNENELKGPNKIQTTFGRKKEISEYQACFIFTPKPARG